MSPFVDYLKYVNDIHPDEGASCVCNNQLNKEIGFDIQIIIPVWNTADTVKRCVDSVIAQDGCKIFISIVNDGSPDNSDEILEQYRHLPNLEIVTQENQGLSGARNTALKDLRAKYVTFVDSDDWLPNGALGAMYKKAEESNADIIQGGYNSCESTGAIISTQVFTDCDDNGTISGFPWGKLFKSEMFVDTCFPHKYWFEDTVVTLILKNKAKTVANVNTVVYNYLFNPKGITQTAKNHLKTVDTYYVTKRLYEDYKSMGGVFKQSQYEDFLSQVAINHSRVHSLGDSLLDKAVFESAISMRNEYFKDFKTSSKKSRYMEMSIDSRHFNRYRFASQLK